MNDKPFVEIVPTEDGVKRDLARLDEPRPVRGRGEGAGTGGGTAASVGRVRARASGTASPVMKSAFDDKDQYVLTELGKQFVHYTMNEIVPRVGAGAQPARTPPSSPAG